MYRIRQQSFFSLQDLLNLQPEQKYSAIFDTIDMAQIYSALAKKSLLGAPDRQNYPAIFRSVIIGMTEGFTTYEALLRRVRTSEEYRWHCGFTGSNPLPNKTAYSRMFTRLAKADTLAPCFNQLIEQAIAEGFIDGKVIAIDSSHVHARDQFYEQTNKPRRSRKKKEAACVHQMTLETEQQPEEISTEEPVIPQPRKKGRKSKAEREKWLREKAEKEAALPLMEKPLNVMTCYTLDEMLTAIPIEPNWGRKKEVASGRNSFKWYGYKLHAAVDCKSQYMLSFLVSAGNMSDPRMAIPLIRLLRQQRANLPMKHLLLDAGYDYESIYSEARKVNTWALIDNNPCYVKKDEQEDEHFRPLCPQGFSYTYDSLDKRYDALKFVRPKEKCQSCPLLSEGTCKKVIKIKVSDNCRKYTFPARGSEAHEKLYDQRTAVERVFAYLKGQFQLDNVRHRGGRKAKMNMELACLLYTACKLSVDRINQAMNTPQLSA